MGTTKYDDNKIKRTNPKIYVENAKWEKPGATMSKKWFMMMGEYKIDLKAMWPKKWAISDYKTTSNALSKNKNSRTYRL